jgi:hypothetical protein
MKDILCEELERVFDKKMLLGEFNDKVGREDIFKPKLGMTVCTKLVMIMELE